jgi:hypothetical protein
MDHGEQGLGGRQQGLLKALAGDQAVEVEDGGVLVRVERGRAGQADQQPDDDGHDDPAQRPEPAREEREGAVTGGGPLLHRPAWPRGRDLQRTHLLTADEQGNSTWFRSATAGRQAG